MAAKQVLVTRVDDDTYRIAADLLRGADMDVHKAQWDSTTLELVQSTSFDVIVIGFPLSESALNRFLDTARSDGSACRRVGLILLTGAEHHDQAHLHVGKGANRVVTTDAMVEQLVSAVRGLCGPAPRVPLRAPVRIKLYADGRPLRVMAQVENLSTSGMLLRGITQFPVGTTFDFDIHIPGDDAPIRGSAEITRATDPNEQIVGIGVRFSSFYASDRTRLEIYLSRQLPEGVTI